MSKVISIIRKGVLFTFIDKYGNVLIQIFTTAILARLLSPYEFGLIAVVMVFITFFGLLTEMGIGPAIVQYEDLDDKDVNSIFNFTFISGVIFALLFYLLVGYIAKFYNDKIYIEIVHYLALVVFFSTLSIVPRAILLKQKKFSVLTKISLEINVFLSFITIYLAYIGFSYYAILIRAILSSMLIFFGSFFFSKIGWKGSFKIRALKKICNFSIFQFAFNFINYFSRNLDNLLIGKYLGTQYLGLYEKAYTLMILPVNNLTHVLTPVLQTSLVSYQNDRQFVYNTYLKLVKVLALLGIPVSVIFYFNAYELIYLFFGEKWLGIVDTFRILSSSIWIQVILSSTGSIYQVINRTDLLFMAGILCSLVMVSMIVLGIISGTLEAIAFYLLIAFLVNFIQGYYILIVRALKEDIWKFYKVMIKPIIIGLVMIGVLLINPVNSGSIIESFFIKIAISLIVYLVCLYVMDEFKFIKKIFKNS